MSMRTVACGRRMAHRKWKETKQQPSLLTGPAVPGCSLLSFHFLWAILCPQAAHSLDKNCVHIRGLENLRQTANSSDNF